MFLRSVVIGKILHHPVGHRLWEACPCKITQRGSSIKVVSLLCFSIFPKRKIFTANCSLHGEMSSKVGTKPLYSRLLARQVTFQTNKHKPTLLISVGFVTLQGWILSARQFFPFLRDSCQKQCKNPPYFLESRRSESQELCFGVKFWWVNQTSVQTCKRIVP